MKCYENYPKVYKRLGPNARNGGLESCLQKLICFKLLLEDRFTALLRKYLPKNIPVEIVKIILDFAVSGKFSFRRIFVYFFRIFRKTENWCRAFHKFLCGRGNSAEKISESGEFFDCEPSQRHPHFQNGLRYGAVLDLSESLVDLPVSHKSRVRFVS